MSYEHINHVRDHSKTRGSARLILFAIASRTDENGYAFPGYARLSRDTKLPIRTIARAIKEIPPNELVIIRPGRSEKGKKRQSATYRVEINQSATPPDHGRGVNSANRKLNVTKGATIDNVSNDHGRGVNSTIDKVSTEPLTWCHPNSHKQSKEQSVEQSASLPKFFVAEKEKTEELPPKASPKPSETKEQLIERLTQEFKEFPAVNVLEAAQTYEQRCKDNGKEWTNRIFVSVITELHNRQKRGKE